MRIDPVLETCRIKQGDMSSPRGAKYGAFDVPGPCAMRLAVVASEGFEDIPESADWEHVSVSGRRTPNWEEMCFIRRLFWEDEDWVVQFHPPRSEYVNNHSHCLHLWRFKGKFPTPPSILVGIKGVQLV